MVIKNDMDSLADLGYDRKKGIKGDENMTNAHAISPIAPIADDWVTTGEAAKLLKVGITTIKRWIKTGRLEGRRLNEEGGWIQVSTASIQSLLAAARDPDVIRMQALEKSLEETKDLGAELTPEDLDDLAMSKLGKLPWQV